MSELPELSPEQQAQVIEFLNEDPPDVEEALLLLTYSGDKYTNAYKSILADDFKYDMENPSVRTSLSVALAKLAIRYAHNSYDIVLYSHPYFEKGEWYCDLQVYPVAMQDHVGVWSQTIRDFQTIEWDFSDESLYPTLEDLQANSDISDKINEHRSWKEYVYDCIFEFRDPLNIFNVEQIPHLSIDQSYLWFLRTVYFDKEL